MLCLFLGAAYLTLKTDGDLHDRIARLSGRLGWLAAAVVFGWLTWSHLGLSVGFVPNPIDALALIAVVAAAWLAEARSEGWAFAAAAVAIGSVVGSIFFDLFPRVMVSSTNSAYNLTVANSASPHYTLKVMTVVAVVFFPVVLGYQAWSLWIFRSRLRSRRANSRTRDRPEPHRPIDHRGAHMSSSISGSPFPPIAEYGFLSDCHTGALVAAGRLGGLAVRPELRQPEHVRQRAGPRRGVLPVRAVRHQRADGADLHAGNERAGDHLAHPERLA